MITDALFSIFEAVVGAIVALIPTVPAPDLQSLAASLGPVWAQAGWLNKYVPLDQAAVMLGVLLTAWVVLYGIRFTIWVLTKAHILGGT